MAVPILIVDAFVTSAGAFSGNQAGVCLLPAGQRVTDDWQQKVAAEMGYAETAFLTPPGSAGGAWGLRWFTPAKEVPLCGHATLASAHVLWERGLLAKDRPARFDTKSGLLTCNRGPKGVTMDFPTDPPVASNVPSGTFAALGIREVPVVEGKTLSNYLLALPDEAAVRAVAPDFTALRKVSATHAFIVTAPAADGDGYVCRYFAPAWGIDEDPATGSIQCTLGPYWAPRLGQKELRCRQLSKRGAAMVVRPDGARTSITGTAVTTVDGTLKA